MSHASLFVYQKIDKIEPKQNFTNISTANIVLTTRRSFKPTKSYKETTESEDDAELDVDENKCVPSEHFDHILVEVPCNLLKSNILYMVRIFHQRTDSYYYKIGFTNDLARRIKELNSAYVACGRIIVVMVAKVNDERNETACHKKLKKYRAADVVTNAYTVSRETYLISSDMHAAAEKVFRSMCVDSKEKEKEKENKMKMNQKMTKMNRMKKKNLMKISMIVLLQCIS